MGAKRWWIAAFAIGFTVGCVVSLDPDKNTFGCEDDSDCGGDGYICAQPANAAKRCCKPTGPEVCNGLDDDCNGLIDDALPAETCNGIDDNCNGQIDEGFNLQTDKLNCGQCGVACTASQICDQGTCKTRGETLCGDGLDNDNDGKTDCEDNDCDAVSCGTGCVCRNLAKAETNCSDGLDDDGDGKIDCEDSDCDTIACGTGCLCANGLKTETICNDNLDNNADGGADCADVSCLGQLCRAAPSTFRCTGPGQCQCADAGTNPGAETNFARCNDGVDNDCSGQSDCADPGCNNISCQADAGLGCQCKNGVKTEVKCNDGLDNNGDGKTDCVDPTCNLSFCEADGGTGCQCKNLVKTEAKCDDFIDNDGDGKVDCAEMLPDAGGDCPGGTACKYMQGPNIKNGTCTWNNTSMLGECK